MDTKFLSENVEVRDHLRDLDIGILRGTVFSHVDWIHIAQDTVQWWALVNMAMNLQVPREQFSFELIQQLLASHPESPPWPYHFLLKCSQYLTITVDVGTTYITQQGNHRWKHHCHYFTHTIKVKTVSSHW
jgi:hypothetical protein